MLTQLTSNQIAKHWDEIKTHLETTLVPFVKVTPTMLNNIFEAFLAGRAQVWTSWKWDGDGQVKVYAMATTYIQIEPISGTRNLLIYSLSGYSFIAEDLWREGIEVIRKFAIECKCANILAYSSVPRVLEIASMLGGKIDTSYIEWKVGD